MKKEKYFLNIVLLLVIIHYISSDTAYILMNHLFSQIKITEPICIMKDVVIPSNRGKIENLDDILKEQPETDLYDNPFVYLSDRDQLKYKKYFSDKTIYFTSFQVSWEDAKDGLCYVHVDKWHKYNYIIMAPAKMGYIYFPLSFFLFAYSVPIAIFKIYKSRLKKLVMFQKIHFYKFTQRLILLLITIIISAFTIYYVSISCVIYSLYKVYLLLNLIISLEGYSIIHFNKSSVKFTKYFIILFLYDALISLYAEYVLYLLPNFDNFYLVHIKSFIEHIVFLIMIFVYMFKRYVHMKKQYCLEYREKTMLAIGYEIKIKLYLKLMIFSIIYCFLFLLFPFIEKMYMGIDNVVETYYLHYFITIGLESICNLVLALILLPKDLTVYFFLPTIFDYNSFKIEALIKQKFERKLNVSNLNYDLMTYEYQEKQYPLIFINPFTKTDNVFKDIRVAYIKKNKSK